MVMDVLWATVLATALLMMLTVAIVKQAKAQSRLARDAHRLPRPPRTPSLALQCGEPLPAGASMEKLPDTAPAGRTWVRVHVTDQGHPAELVGLITADAGAH